MAPFAAANLLSSSLPTTNPSESNNIITLNVGGQLFQTIPQTLALAGPQSFLAATAATAAISVPFIDRDPELFSVLLSFLRTGRLPSKAAALDLHDVVVEAQYYGIDPASLFDSSNFDAFALQKSQILPLNGRDAPSVIATSPSGSIHVAHGSKITSFDMFLRRKSTVLTSFPAVDSLLALTSSIVAAGATDFPGLRVLDLNKGSTKSILNWVSYPLASSTNSTVQAIGLSPDHLFGSFESSRRNSSVIVAFDLAGGAFRPVVEFGRGDIYGAELDSAIPATKLRWVLSSGLLMASGTHRGPSGLVGNIRLWDIRSCKDAVWELSEKIDCFADITVSESLSAIFKVGMNSGEVFMMDLRKLSSGNEENSWFCLGDPWRRTTGNGKSKEGTGCCIESYGNKVFCSKGGDVEMWSEVVMDPSGGLGPEDGFLGGRVMRKTVMGKVKNSDGSKITQLRFGGNRMVLSRKDQQSVEVWESPVRR